MYSSHSIYEESLIRSNDLIRPPLLKVGQYDPSKVKMDSLEVGQHILCMLPPGVYHTYGNPKQVLIRSH